MPWSHDRHGAPELLEEELNKFIAQSDVHAARVIAEWLRSRASITTFRTHAFVQRSHAYIPARPANSNLVTPTWSQYGQCMSGHVRLVPTNCGSNRSLRCCELSGALSVRADKPAVQARSSLPTRP